MASIRKDIATAKAQMPTKIKAMGDKISPEVIKQIKKDKEKIVSTQQTVKK